MIGSVRLASIFLSLLVLAAASGGVCAQGKSEFNLPAQPLAESLRAVGSQTNTNVLVEPELVDGRQAPALRAALTIDEALSQLLVGTGLEYRFLNEKTIVLAVAESISSSVEGAGAPLENKGGEGHAQRRSFLDRSRVAQTDQGKTATEDAVEKSDKTSGVDESEKLEEITVTAQKRQERLLEVPISISVLTGEDLDQSTAQGVTEALNTVPGVTAQESYIGGGTQISVRGVSGSSPILHGSSPIAYYLDSVPFGLIKTSIAPDANAYDLQRVEVLRGPQGTLYGASALNGVVRVLTHDADLDAFEFKARTSISSTEGGDANYRADAALNIPLVADKLAIRAVAGYQDLSGWIEKANAKNVNSAQISNIRFKVNAQPTDALSIGLSTWFSRDDRDSPPQAQDNDFHAIAAKEPQSNDYDAYGLTIGYDFAPLTVTSMSSYLRYQNNGVLNMGELGLSGAEFVNRYFAEVVSEEITLNSSSAGPWRWTLGGLYRDEKDRTAQDFPGIEAHGFSLGPFDFDDTSKSFAVYGEMTRAILDGHLELTAGLRYFEDDVATHENRLPAGAAALIPPTSSSFEKVTPRAVITWMPSDDFTGYVSYGEGFRSGSQQQPGVIRSAPGIPPLEADSLTNYEVGSKGRWASGLVSYEAALYYIDWNDVQTDSSILISGLPQVAMVNGDSASGVGFDLALAFHPTDHWDLGVSFSRNGLTYDGEVLIATAGGDVVLFPEGSRLSMSPRTSAGGFIDYAFPLGAGGYKGRVSASASYASSQYMKIADGVGQGESILIARSSFTVDAPSNWTFSLYADNLTNEDGAIQRAPFFNAPDWTVRPRPRTIGLQVEFRY